MGERAKSIIKSIINYLNSLIDKKIVPSEVKSNWNEKSVRDFIDIIGEPVLKSSLRNLYVSAFLTNKESINKEIKRLQDIQSKLK